MDNKTLHRVFGTLSFLLAAVVYIMTVQPSVPFWDCGEFTSAATWQQVPHPPGAPLFLMIGKVFQIIIPFGDLGWRVNLAAAFSGAFSVLFAYLITVKVLENFRGLPKNTGEALSIYTSGFIAAAALTFSDTMWFNSVESEVYATSLTFVALIVWLMMKWNEKADLPGHERYLLLIAYLIGLSTGVHLLSILTVFSIVLVVYFRKYEFSWRSFIIMGIIAIFIFFFIYPVVVKWIPAFLAGHTADRHAMTREYAVENSSFLQIIAIGSILLSAFGFWYGIQKKRNILSLATGAFILVILGYTTYTQILLRSNANPPMNENEPKNFSKLASYLGREQYGNAPTWPRRYQTEDYFIQNYVSKDQNGNYIYGEWYPPTRTEVRRKDGTYVGAQEFTKINSSGEINYLMKYQINHMYFRYFGWNFIGRTSDVQDAGVAWFSVPPDNEVLNYKSGYADQFPVRFFALPLLFGLFGFVFHFYRDPKMALAYLAMFLVMGVLAAIQQNQQDPQPRERDYFYAGSFMVWAIWIGLGSFSLVEWFGKKKISSALAMGVFAGSFLLVPLNMAIGGWKIHSRAGNYLPFDYAYNILQSCEENAIIFTNGDNDTFPLWWIQDVAGVRRDVRVANLSLGNTLWYVDQLKNRQPWGAEKLPLSFSDDSLQKFDESDERSLTYDFGEAQNVVIPVRREILEKYTDDPQILADGNMRFTFTGKEYTKQENKPIYLIRVQDKLVLDILKQIRFERPVYFSNTVGPDAYAGLESFFRYEGMAMRICPVQQIGNRVEVVDEEIMEKCLMTDVDNTDYYSTTPRYGFKFRNLNNPDVYYDEVGRRLMSSYRSLYMMYANHLIRNKQDKQKAVEVLDKMGEYISYSQFPLSFDWEYRIAQLYNEAGDKEKAQLYASMGIKTCEELISNNNIAPEYGYYEAIGRRIGPYTIAAYLYEIKEDYKGAIDVLEKLKNYSLQILSMTQANTQEGQALNTRLGDIEGLILDYKITETELKDGKEAALKQALDFMKVYENSNLPYKDRILNALRMRITEMTQGDVANIPTAFLEEYMSN
ncbi:MAG: DUF2723 domain-containing protein [Candidatus Kapabacteria bacterium]|nr:DUF2723 domain-containing protein [Ignavibacteriota bacterium]MCW5886065.1 DUF2723 domain-containing protein [Candidatus Kapabacteria bacterium]